MLHLKSSEGKQLACWKIMSFSASDFNFSPHPSSSSISCHALTVHCTGQQLASHSQKPFLQYFCTLLRPSCFIMVVSGPWGWAGVTFCFSGFTASGFVSVIAWKLGNLHWCAADIFSPQLGQEGSLPGLPVFTNSTLLRDTVHLSCLFTFGTFWNFTNFNWNFESFLDFGWKQGVQVDGVN